MRIGHCTFSHNEAVQRFRNQHHSIKVQIQMNHVAFRICAIRSPIVSFLLKFAPIDFHSDWTVSHSCPNSEQVPDEVRNVGLLCQNQVEGPYRAKWSFGFLSSRRNVCWVCTVRRLVDASWCCTKASADSISSLKIQLPRSCHSAVCTRAFEGVASQFPRSHWQQPI